MKILKQALLILVSSPLFWIGAAGALISFSTFCLLWTGHLGLLAELIDFLHVGIYAGPFFAFILLASICVGASGIILGIVRLGLKLSKKLAREHRFYLFAEPEQRKSAAKESA